MYQMGLLSLCNKLFVYKYINKFTISPVFMRNLRCLTEWNDGRLSFHQEMHSLPAEVSSVSHLCKDKKKSAHVIWKMLKISPVQRWKVSRPRELHYLNKKHSCCESKYIHASELLKKTYGRFVTCNRLKLAHFLSQFRRMSPSTHLFPPH